MLEGAVTAVLPHGLLDDAGVWHRRAVLRPLTGREEMVLAAGPAGGAAAVSALLAAVVERIGGYEPVDPELAALLTRGDREVLLLRLRAALYGDRLAMVIYCANPACRAAADVDLKISALAPEPPAEPRAPIACATPEGDAVIREPTGEDDAAVEDALAAGDRAAASALLWSRLVELGGRALSTAEWRALPAATRHALALALAAGSRAPDLAFVARCIECEAWIEIELDPWRLLVRELAAGGDRLLAEVHALAFHYHWSEHDILSLPRARRWRYLQLLGRELEGRPLLDPRS
jgi:hypothetical protein